MLEVPTIEIDLISGIKKRQPPRLQDEIPFGRIPTNHMFICDFIKNKGGWQTPKIGPVQNFELPPSSLVFHYGQEIFEGLKAYKDASLPRAFHLFRHDKNAQRFLNSARRLGMVQVPTNLFMKAVEELVKVEAEWLLEEPGSLYIRPTLIPLDAGISYRAGEDYRFFVVLSPAKNYYGSNEAITISVEREFVRAAPGGSGEAKCGGNYATALPGLLKAKAQGADQCLWLDAFHRKYVEEVGTMNIMFVYGNQVITPELNGSILPGVTRDSIIAISEHLGFPVTQARIDMNEVIKDIKSGRLTEAFGCGTAAVVTSIGHLIDDGKRIKIADGKAGSVAVRFKEAITAIQCGKSQDLFGWRKTFHY